MKFNIGDIVIPKSGGDKMTIVGITENGNYICMWFINGKKGEDNFPEAFLESNQDAELRKHNLLKSIL